MRVDQPPDVITLVHGTFARHAAWTRKDSKLYGKLAKRFPNARIQAFEWSGENSHRARIDAGLALAALIESQQAECPNARHAIVAHSHGGNVALYAIRSEVVKNDVATLVFLSTPFLRCRTRNVARPFKFLGPMVSWFLLFPVFAPFLLLGLVDLFIWSLQAAVNPNGPNYEVMGGLGIFLGTGVGGLLALWYLRSGRSRFRRWLTNDVPLWLEERGTRYLAFVATPEPECRCLTVYTKRDEALAWLTSLNAISVVPIMGTTVLAEVMRRLWLPTVFLVLTTILVTSVRDGDSEYGFTLSFNAALAPYLIVCAVSIVLYLGAYIVPPIVRGTRVGFGGEGLISNVAVSVLPSATPALSPKARASQFVVTGNASEGGLRHSAAYADDSAIDVVASFLAGDDVPPTKTIKRLPLLGRLRTVLTWAIVAISLGTSMWFIYRGDRRLSMPIAASVPRRDVGLPLTVVSSRTLLSVQRSIGPKSHIELPFAVQQSFTTSHCHIRGTYTTNLRAAWITLELDDWFQLTEDDIRKMRASNIGMSSAERARLKPMDQPSKVSVIKNLDEYKDALSFAFDEHPEVTIPFTKTGVLSIGNPIETREAHVTATINLVCFDR